ncbi:AAEL004122-PA [Aedes aegypti]|uniref:AAEL004122-PA n=1 Tax=Aedes aegypti TaxID=7159 RepID=Q17DK9_AEDAE|nr:AAEL004122-PA [Aedes aegypti]
MARLKKSCYVWLLFLVICSVVLAVYSDMSAMTTTEIVASSDRSAEIATEMSGNDGTTEVVKEVSEIPSSTALSESSSVVVTSGPTQTMEGLTTGLAVDVSTGASAATSREEEKKGDIELESETPVISFGIRSFTVEVGTGTERSSDEPVLMNATQPENATQQQGDESATTSQVNFSTDSLGDVATTVSVEETVSTIGTSEATHVESTPGKSFNQELTSDAGQAVVTINTKLTNEKPINMDESNEEQHLSNEIRVEKKNGLYRIKIAEITTDEFDNGLHESDNENMLMPADIMAAPKSIYPSKINIDDFYPSKLEDFKPLSSGGNSVQREEVMQEKMLREKAILRNEDNEKLFESTIMKPSEVLPIIDSKTDSSDEDRSEGDKKGQDNNGDISTTKIEIELIDDTSETSTSDEGKPSIDNITEKLEENDEVISRIEENFKGYKTFEPPEEEFHEEPTPKKKDDEVITIAISSVTFSSSQQLSTQMPPTLTPIAGTTTQSTQEEVPIPVSGSDIVKANYGNLFIPRRVKKNDPTTSKLNVFNSAPLKKIDFANTKFNTDNSGSPHDPKDASKKDKPEFSTTKFYNSKELYSELHHQMMNDSDHRHPNRNSPVVPKKTTVIVSEKDILTAKTLSKPSQTQSTVTAKKLPPKSVTPTNVTPVRQESNIKKQLLQTNFIPREDTPNPPPTTKPHAIAESTSVNRPLHPQDQQKKIKSLGAAASAIIAATTKLTKDNSKAASARNTPAAISTTTSATTITNLRKPQPSSTKPGPSGESLITRPAITPLSRLQEKINTLDCDIQAVSPDSSIWRGNETHDLNLPITKDSTDRFNDSQNSTNTTTAFSD